MHWRHVGRWGLLLMVPALLGWTVWYAERSVETVGQLNTQPMVALSFDDGPRRETTLTLLDGLARRGVSCTFFLVGELLDGNEDVVQRMAREGHQVGIHTYDHVWLTGLSESEGRGQLERVRVKLEEILGEGDYWLRPPYGGVDEGVRAWADVPMVLWSVDPEDWSDRDTERVVEHILEQVTDGDIILLHDIYDSSVEAALRVVDALHERGFLLVTVEELAASRGVEIRAGEVYRCFPP